MWMTGMSTLPITVQIILNVIGKLRSTWSHLTCRLPKNIKKKKTVVSFIEFCRHLSCLSTGRRFDKDTDDPDPFSWLVCGHVRWNRSRPKLVGLIFQFFIMMWWGKWVWEWSSGLCIACNLLLGWFHLHPSMQCINLGRVYIYSGISPKKKDFGGR